MSHIFSITVTTDHGSVSGERRANSIQQIAKVMPEAVKHYEAKLVPMTADDALVDGDTLANDFLMDVSHLEYASTMTPERVAEEHEKQFLALQGLEVRVSPGTTNE